MPRGLQFVNIAPWDNYDAHFHSRAAWPWASLLLFLWGFFVPPDKIAFLLVLPPVHTQSSWGSITTFSSSSSSSKVTICRLNVSTLENGCKIPFYFWLKDYKAVKLRVQFTCDSNLYLSVACCVTLGK